MGVILICMGGIGIVAGTTWLMLRLNRADQQKIEVLREEWEASGKDKPWAWGVNWTNGGGS